MQYSQSQNLNAVIAFNNQAISSDTTTVGNIIDTNGYNSLTYFVNATAFTDGSYDVILEQSDDATFATGVTTLNANVDYPYQVGTFTPITVINTISKVGSVGKDRYQRLSIVSTGVTTGATLEAFAVQGMPKNAPVV